MKPWNRLHDQKSPVTWVTDPSAMMELVKQGAILGAGNLLSYGDCCLNNHGTLIRSENLRLFRGFDPLTGILTCGSGVRIADILRFFIPQGWFVPVTPGASHVTVGGALANDVHGKNHHVAGNFGSHVKKIILWRSTEGRVEVEAGSELFAATVGGLGLTGFIEEVSIQLVRESPWFAVETTKFESLDEYFRLSEESDRKFDYTVAWVDCFKAGRGHLICGKHCEPVKQRDFETDPALNFPMEMPSWALNSTFLQIFNSAYFHKQQRKVSRSKVWCQSFLYPLDAIGNWNKAYGKKGFYQYQFVVPESATDSLREAFATIESARMGSFLAVLKKFGTIPNQGLLSFSQPGYTLALDFPNRGVKLLRLFQRLDEIVLSAGGRLYPAKDSRMSREVFCASFPNWRAFSEWKDPSFNSDFWERVVGQNAAPSTPIKEVI